MTQQIKLLVKDAGPKPTGDLIKKNLFGSVGSAILIYQNGPKNECLIWCLGYDVIRFFESSNAFSKQPDDSAIPEVGSFTLANSSDWEVIMHALNLEFGSDNTLLQFVRGDF